MASKSKTTPNYATSVDELHISQKSIEDAAEALRAAQEDCARLDAQLAEAEEFARDVRAGIASGKIDPTGDDLARADSRVEAMQLAADGADRRLRQIKQQGAVTSLDLLACVEKGLVGIMPGVTTVFSTEAPPEQCPGELSLPVLWVSQVTPHKVAMNGYRTPSRTGAIAGELLAKYYRHEAHKELREEKIASALASRVPRDDVACTVRLTRQDDYADSFKIAVKHAVPPLPRLAKAPQEGRRHLENPVLVLLNRIDPDGERFGTVYSNTHGRRFRALEIGRGNHKATVTKVTSSSGKTSATISAEATVTSPHGHLERLSESIEKAAGGLVGTATSEGVYEAVEASCNYMHGGTEVTVTLDITAVSAAE